MRIYVATAENQSIVVLSTDKWFEVPRLTLCLETLLDFCTNMYVVKDHCSQLQNLLLITHIDEQQQVDVIYDTYGLIITPI